MKYTGQKISAIEAQIIEPFLKNNIKIIQSKVSFRARFNSFLRPLRSITFYNNNPTQEGF
jgi:vacuolar-type H+-ATPase subunit D/Vma8